MLFGKAEKGRENIIGDKSNVRSGTLALVEKIRSGMLS